MKLYYHILKAFLKMIVSFVILNLVNVKSVKKLEVLKLRLISLLNVKIVQDYSISNVSDLLRINIYVKLINVQHVIKKIKTY